MEPSLAFALSPSTNWKMLKCTFMNLLVHCENIIRCKFIDVPNLHERELETRKCVVIT